MTVNKGLKSLAESTPNFSNQALENAINDIKAIDKDDGYQFIKSQFAVDTAIHNNTVLTTSQKNDALETLYAAQPHLQIGRYLNDTIRHTNKIIDGSIIPGDPDIAEGENGQGTFREILQLVQGLQSSIPEIYGVTAKEKARSVTDHLGLLNNMFTRSEDSTQPIFTRLKELMLLIRDTATAGGGSSALAIGTAAVRFSNTQLVTFLAGIRDDSTDFQTSLDNRVNQSAGNMASLNTRIGNAIQGDIINELVSIRNKIVTQQTLENSNITSLRTFTTTVTDNEAFVSLAEDPELRKLMANVSQNSSWQTYFNDYEKNLSYQNPIYTTNTDSDKSSTIDLVLASRGLPDVTDHFDFQAVAKKATQDSRIDTKNFDLFTTEEVITKSCEQLGIITANRLIEDQSKSLLQSMNDHDRQVIAGELDQNEDAKTLS
tara:strand:- start:299 stop:1591 length:1293 start_codon:yes stop_codon:yes gene_type:complete